MMRYDFEKYYILKEVNDILHDTYINIRRINNYKLRNKYLQSLGLFLIIGVPEPIISNIIGLKLILLSKILGRGNLFDAIRDNLNKIRLIKSFYNELQF
jgi:hypothetical protein